MKVYICDMCKKQAIEETAIGVYRYGHIGWTVRKLSDARNEADNEQHVCSSGCLGKFFDRWLNPKREKGGENA